MFNLMSNFSGSHQKMDVGGFFVTLQVIPFNNIAHDLLLNKLKALDKSLAI